MIYKLAGGLLPNCCAGIAGLGKAVFKGNEPVARRLSSFFGRNPGPMAGKMVQTMYIFQLVFRYSTDSLVGIRDCLSLHSGG
jgi:hypothetical protein